MNSIPFALRVAGTIFGLASLAHLLRLILQLPVVIGSFHLPMVISSGGFLIAGLLAFWLWWVARPHHTPPPAGA